MKENYKVIKAQELQRKDSEQSLGTAAFKYTQNKYGEGYNRPSDKHVLYRGDTDASNSLAIY